MPSPRALRLLVLLLPPGLLALGGTVAAQSEVQVASLPAPLPPIPPAEEEGAPAADEEVAEELEEELEPDAGTEQVLREERVKRRAPPLDSFQGLPLAADLVARSRPDAQGRLTVRHQGRQRTLTVDPVLQRQLTQLMASYETPQAAVVVMEVGTGRVLAMAQHAEGRPELRGLAVRAAFPAASIFKVVTASALLRKGLTAQTEECIHGGKRRVRLAHLTGSARDSECLSLAQAMGKSANAVFARLTHKHLTAEELLLEAERFGFNRPLSFDLPVDVSPAVVPQAPFALAETGAGFGDVYLSPLHGALLASVVANRGVWRDAVLLEPLPPQPWSGEVLQAAFTPDAGAPAPAQQATAPVLTEEMALALTDMLEETVTHGTARGIFRQRGFQVDGAVGKTGTLADKRPFRDYSWFVGFAPREAPKLVVSTVIVNEPRWRIRATWLGREALRLGMKQLEERPGTPPAPPAPTLQAMPSP